MRRPRLDVLVPLIIAAAALSGPVGAQEPVPAAQPLPEIASRIVGITLSSSSARVTREAALPASAGVHTLRVGPLPAIIDDSAVQASGESHHRILSVQVERRSGGDRATPEYIALEARIEELAREADGVGRRREAARARRLRFAGLDVAAPPRREDDPAPLAVDPPAWERFIDLVARGMTEADAEIEALFADLASRQRELARLREQLADLDAPGRRELVHAIVSVQDLTGAGGSLHLEYDVPLALWYPEYAVRIDPDRRRLEISAYGVVHQRTGEAWPELPVRFSTALPETGADLPELASRRIRRERYVEVWSGGDEANELARMDDFESDEKAKDEKRAKLRARRELAAPEPGLAAPATPELERLSDEAKQGVRGFGEVMRLNQFDLPGAPARDAIPEEPAFSGIPAGCILPAESSRGFLRVFESVRPEAVPSDGAPHRLLIARIEVPFAEERSTVPELAALVFRRIRAELPGEDPLLDGSAAVFLGGAYLGESRLPTTAPGEEIVLDIGVDERVSVVRRQEDLEEEIGTFSKGRRYRSEVTVELANAHAEARTVEVRERIPFSEHERITIELDRKGTNPAPSVRKESSGLLSWSVVVPPGGRSVVKLVYRIDAPRDFQLTRAPAPERLEEDDR
jgi:hypothetical protein